MSRFSLTLPQLSARLVDHPPEDVTERGYVPDFAALIERHGIGALQRSTFSPGHITASSFVIDRPGTRLLLLEHAFLGKWLQPGGHVDPGETDILKAALREVYEETGYVDLEVRDPVPFDLDIHPIPARPEKGEPAHHHFDVRFLFVADEENRHPPPEHAPTAWVPFAEVSRRTDDASVLRAVRKIQGR